MRHKEGDLIEPRDCVLLKAGPRKNDLPFVAKVAALWESPEDGNFFCFVYAQRCTEEPQKETQLATCVLIYLSFFPTCFNVIADYYL